MSGYRVHVFFCTNQRDGEPACADCGSRRLQKYAKQRCKELGIHGPDQVRINRAGCLGRCEWGPVIVVYPDGVWYSYVDERDLDEIIQSHLIEGRPVERLMIDPPRD